MTHGRWTSRANAAVLCARSSPNATRPSLRQPSRGCFCLAPPRRHLLARGASCCRCRRRTHGSCGPRVRGRLGEREELDRSSSACPSRGARAVCLAPPRRHLLARGASCCRCRRRTHGSCCPRVRGRLVEREELDRSSSACPSRGARAICLAPPQRHLLARGASCCRCRRRTHGSWWKWTPRRTWSSCEREELGGSSSARGDGAWREAHPTAAFLCYRWHSCLPTFNAFNVGRYHTDL